MNGWSKTRKAVEDAARREIKRVSGNRRNVRIAGNQFVMTGLFSCW
jgi:hypothetical protein